MTFLQDQAICIRRRNYSETSQIVTFFGRASGKISAIGKGSRRSKAKFSGGIDLLTAGTVMFRPPRNDSSLATLTEFNLDESFLALRGDLLSLNCAQHAADLLHHFTEEFDPHETLYDEFFRFLRQLHPRRAAVGLLQFELILLREAGFDPVWDRCCLCSSALPQQQRPYFSSSSGGMLCRNCEPAVIEKRFLTAGALSLLRYPEQLNTAEPTTIIDAHELISYYQRELLGKEPPTMRFVNSLLRRQRAASDKQYHA